MATKYNIGDVCREGKYAGCTLRGWALKDKGEMDPGLRYVGPGCRRGIGDWIDANRRAVWTDVHGVKRAKGFMGYMKLTVVRIWSRDGGTP